MKVFYITRDLGDGSSTVDFYKDKSLAEGLLEDDKYNQYWGNDGIVSSFEIPDGPNTIRFSDDHKE